MLLVLLHVGTDGRVELLMQQGAIKLNELPRTQ